LTCNVCEAEPAVGVASSALGAVSLAYGRTCLDKNADATYMLEGTYLSIGPNLADYAEWVWTITTYRDGEYISARQYFDECNARPGFWHILDQI
jgi:hypothetical protein